MVAAVIPNPNTKAPGATGSSTAAGSPNLGAGYKLPVGSIVNAYGQIVLNPKIGAALAPLASTVVPPAPKPPAPSPSKPATPAVKAPAAPSGSGTSGSSSGSSQDGSSSSTTPVITLAPSSAKGGSTKNSDGNITFTPTGNVPTDLAALEAAGADALTISYYMSQYGNSWNYGIGSQGMSKNIPQNPPREVDGHILTTNTPGMSQAEANAVQILNKAGLTQQAVKSQAVYVFTNPTNPNAQISVSKAAYDSSTPAQQLAIQIQVGNIPKGATIPKSAIVNGVWNGNYVVPGNNTVQNSGPTPLTKYTTTNTDGSQSVNLAAALAGGVTTDYLIQQGFTKQQITQAQEYNSVMTTLKPYTTSAGTNLAAALASGKVTPQQLEDVGFDNSAGGAIQTAEQYNALQAILDNPKNNIKTSAGYQINVALANKNLTVSDLTALGFQQPAITQAQAYNVILNKLSLPATTIQVDPAAAISKGVTLKQWLAAFPDGQATYAAAASAVGVNSNGSTTIFGRASSKTASKTKNLTTAASTSTTNTLSKTAATKLASKTKAVKATTPTVEATTAANAAPASSAIMTEINTALTGKKTMSGQVSALNDAIDNAGLWDNSLLGKRVIIGGTLMYADAKGNLLTQQDQVKIEWNNLTADQKNQVAGLYAQDLYRSNPFSETTKQIAEAGQQGGLVGQMAVAPITGITIPIAKAASQQKLTASDYENAVLTVVGDALMLGGGDVLASGFGTAGRAITNSLLTGMGTVGLVNTVLQVKKGGTSGVAIGVEAGMSAAALLAGAGGLVSSIVPKDAPDVDAAQQFINKMKSETTPEGLAKNSPLLAESGDLSEGPVPPKENATPGGELKPSILSGQSSGFLKPNFTPTQIFAEGYQPPPFDEMTQEMATKTANVTADYKDFAQAAIDYAQNQHDINDLSAKIADNNTTLTAMKESGTLLPDHYTAKLASDMAAMEKTLAALKSSDPDLAQGLNEATDKFSTSMKSYASYLKANGFMADDSGLDEAIKTLPRNSPEMIRTTINQLMNADNSPEAIARQQAVVDAADKEYQQYKGKSGQNADLGAKLIEEQAKLAQMKVGSLAQAQAEMVQAREALSDVNDIMENGKLNDATKANLLKIQNQLESQIADHENIIRTQLIEGRGTTDIVKIEWIKDSEGDTIGARIYSNEGVARYNLDADGNIDYSSKTDETSGGGDKSPNAPTETRPSPDTTSAEESALQQTSRGMPKGGILSSVVAGAALTLPKISVSKNGEVAKPSTKPQTRPQTSPATRPQTKPQTVNPSVVPSKVNTEVVAPQTSTNPAINPSTVQSKAQSKAQQKAQSQQQSQRQSQQQSQSEQQNVEQEMSQSMQASLAASMAVNTPVATATSVQPPHNSVTPIAPIKEKKLTGQNGEFTAEDLANATTWKAGFGWWYRFPNGQYRFLRKPPPGAQPVKPGKGSGYASIQTIKGKPIVDTHRMGAVTVTINRPGKQPGARGAIAYHATGQGKPGLSMTRKGKMVNIRGVGLANINKIPRGRVLRS